MYLLPVPQSINIYPCHFLLKYDTIIVVESRLGFKEYNYARILKQHIEENLGFSLAITKENNLTEGCIYLSLTEELKPEEYKIKIQENCIILLGGSSHAILYGVQTLRQIIAQKGAELPCLEIIDYPQIPNRGFYHDVTRGRIPKLETLKALADKMSYYKLNQLQLYIEHSFLFRDFSEVWRDDTPLTAEEILELDQYCQSINIELVPSIASFGHLYKVLRTKTYASLCELEASDQGEYSFMGRMEHHTIDITNEKSFEMVRKMLLEYIPLFSSSQFNICADETFDLGKGKSKPLADEVGTDQMYVNFVNKLCLFIKANGKRPMFWGDIIIAHPEAMKELPADVICLNWDYCQEIQDTNARKLYEVGATQYLCPGVHGWRRLINRLDYGYNNITSMCKHAHTFGVAGVLNTDWGDYGHMNHPEFSTAGMIYGAAFSWNSNQLGFDEINKQISLLEYKDTSETFLSIVQDMAGSEDFLWECVVQYKETKSKGATKEQMDEFFSRFHIKDAYSSNQKLAVAIDSMYQVMSSMDTSTRGVVKAYLIMAKGILLFNTLGATIGQYIHEVKHELAAEPKQLAVQLEYWLKDYKELWRKDYKEAELYRIQEVVFWYADLLREIY